MTGSDRHQIPINQPYEYPNTDAAYKRDGTIPPTPSARTIPPSLTASDVSHEQFSTTTAQNPQAQNGQTQGQMAEPTKSPSHRYNNNATLPGGMSPSEAAVQWPLDRVLLWLAMNGFSGDWQETFKALEIQGADFLELGHGFNGRPNWGKMHNVIYPQLARECENSGTGWDLTREREEGKRMRKLIRQIQDDPNHDTGVPIPRQRESQTLAGGILEPAAESSPKFANDPVSAGPMSSSPNFKTLQPTYNQKHNVQTRSFTTPIPTSHDHTASETSHPDGTLWGRSDISRAALANAGGDHRRQSPSVSSENGNFPPVRSYDGSPKSGSPAMQHATLAHSGFSSTSDFREHARVNSSDSNTGRRYYETLRQDNARPSPQESYNRPAENTSSYPKDHSSRLFHFFKKKNKSGDSSHPSPEEQFLESPTSPEAQRHNQSQLPYDRPNFSSSDMSLERPLSASFSDHERAAQRQKPVAKGKRWAFGTLDGWNYRLMDITDLDSVEQLRASICQNLGISDWAGSQIFVTEPGQLDHDEPLNDTNLALCRRKKSDALGTLKLYVRGPVMPSGSTNSPHYTGLGVSFPDKATASPTTGQHQLQRKPLDDEALHRISPHNPAKPTSPQVASRPQQLRTPAVKMPSRDITQLPMGTSPVDGGPDSGYPFDAEKLDPTARQQEEQRRELERRQKASRFSKVTPVPQPGKNAYGETGYRRKELIDFDSPRISPYEDKKAAEPLVPLRKPPTAPPESNTLTKVNSLRKTDRPSVHGLGAALAGMGRITGAIGTPSPSVSQGPGFNSPNANVTTPGKTLAISRSSLLSLVRALFYVPSD